MAFIIKNANKARATGPDKTGQAYLMEFVHVATAARTIPQNTTDQIFQVVGGRVLMHLLVGEVTTVIQSQTTNIKVSSKKLDTALATGVGTAVDISANVDGNAKEVGSLYVVLQSGAAAIWSNAGAGLSTLGNGPIVLPNGEVYLTTTVSSTGAMKWDMWYQPLDEGAYVKSVVSATAAI